MDEETRVHFDEDKGVVCVTLEGRLTVRTIVAAVGSLAHRPRMHRLWDIRNADLSTLDFGAVWGMAEAMASLPPVHPDARIAIVAASDVQFGMSRMYEVLIEGRSPGTHRIFRDIEEAEAWLTEGSAG